MGSSAVTMAYLLDFIDALKPPLVTTLHTVLQSRKVTSRATKAIINASDAVVVLAQNAKQLLVSTRCATGQDPPSPTGYRMLPVAEVLQLRKAELGLSGRLVVSTRAISSSSTPSTRWRPRPATPGDPISDHRSHPPHHRNEGEATGAIGPALRAGHRERQLQRYLTLREPSCTQATDVYSCPP